MMDDEQEHSARAMLATLWRALRPAVPAVIGAAALTFLFAAVMPLAWVASISWQLYLDRLSDLFVPPVGNGGRLALAIGMALLAALLAGFVALALARPQGRGNRAMNRRVAARAKRQIEDAEIEILPRRRRADSHPDDAPRPPIRAGRDLPEGGLGPLGSAARAANDERDIEWVEPAGDELVLADLAPIDDDPEGADAPWLQPAELTAPVSAEPVDNSLGAMVARFEAGLVLRREAKGETPVPATAEAAPEVDFALEAALSTLQRMTRRAVG